MYLKSRQKDNISVFLYQRDKKNAKKKNAYYTRDEKGC